MGHSSITVTETYLKPFRNKKIDEANIQVLDFVAVVAQVWRAVYELNRSLSPNAFPNNSN